MDWAGENRGTDKDALLAGALASGNWEAAPTAPRDPFSVHVFACLVTLAAQESIASGATIWRDAGFARAPTSMLFSPLPRADQRLVGDATPRQLSSTKRKSSFALCSIAFACDDSLETGWLVSMLARRCMSPNHLWQDLGLSIAWRSKSFDAGTLPSARRSQRAKYEMEEVFLSLPVRNGRFYSLRGAKLRRMFRLFRLFWRRDGRQSPNASRCARRKRLKLLSDKAPLDHPRAIEGGPFRTFCTTLVHCCVAHMATIA